MSDHPKISTLEPATNPSATARLIEAIQGLSLARSLEAVMEIVRHAARDLTGADGATFVLRDGDLCHYAHEDAIGPLWRGKRFPMNVCISGWAMLHRRAAVIEDVYADPRIPADAYRPTFVQSLAMVPIRTADPIGAIGNYWARRHHASPEEVQLLQALADSTSIALENVVLYNELERRVANRTAALAVANQELEAFSYSVSHDLRTPLRAVRGFCRILLDEHAGRLDARGRECLERIAQGGQHMHNLIDDLLRLAQVGRCELNRTRTDLGADARLVADGLARSDPSRKVRWVIEENLDAYCAPSLLRIVLENLLGNAWKFTARQDEATIELGRRQVEGEPVYMVRDNGAGFDMREAEHLFAPFQRFHRQSEFAGSGIGLAIVARIIGRHGGRIWAESRLGGGSTFFWTLPAEEDPAAGGSKSERDQEGRLPAARLVMLDTPSGAP